MQSSVHVHASQATIVAFMDQKFERITSTQKALKLLQKFESLNLPNLGIEDKYRRVFMHYRFVVFHSSYICLLDDRSTEY